MAENIEMKAVTRDIIGKANRKLDNSQLAAVVYGTAIEPMAVSVDRHEFELALSHEGNIASRLIDLKIDGGKTLHVIAKSIQRDPTKGLLRHVDFWAVNMRQVIATTVPVHFEGDSPGVRAGGVMMHNVTAINVEALPDELPEAVTVDISNLEVGDSLHVRDLVAPKGATILDDPDEIVASVVAPVAEEEEVIETEEVEPELVGGEKSEEE
jgi:large subunit ribosomal protein L25